MRMARCLRLERLWAQDRPSLNRRQSATTAGQATAGARVPRRTPAGPSHAVRRRPMQVSTADALGHTLRNDLFVPKQLG